MDKLPQMVKYHIKVIVNARNININILLLAMDHSPLKEIDTKIIDKFNDNLIDIKLSFINLKAQKIIGLEKILQENLKLTDDEFKKFLKDVENIDTNIKANIRANI